MDFFRETSAMISTKRLFIPLGMYGETPIWVPVKKEAPWKTLTDMIDDGKTLAVFCRLYLHRIPASPFGIVGLMKKFGYEGAPLIPAFVLSTLTENAVRQSLIMAHGSSSIFFMRPIAVTFFVVGLFLLVFPLIPGLKKRPKGGDII